MILAGNVALESMGFKTFGFVVVARTSGNGGGRLLGSENKWLDDKRTPATGTSRIRSLPCRWG